MRKIGNVLVCTRKINSYLQLHRPLDLDVATDVLFQLLEHRSKRWERLMIFEVFVEESRVFLTLSHVVNLKKGSGIKRCTKSR